MHHLNEEYDMLDENSKKIVGDLSWDLEKIIFQPSQLTPRCNFLTISSSFLFWCCLLSFVLSLKNSIFATTQNYVEKINLWHYFFLLFHRHFHFSLPTTYLTTFMVRYCSGITVINTTRSFGRWRQSRFRCRSHENNCGVEETKTKFECEQTSTRKTFL